MMNRENVLQTSPLQQMHSWHDHNQELQDSSFIQLLMSGMVEDQGHKQALTHMQNVKKFENLEDDSMMKLLVKQEASLDTYGYKEDDKDVFRDVKSTNWTDQLMQSSCTSSCVTSLSRSEGDERVHPRPDRSTESNSNSGSGGAIKKAKVQTSLNQSTFKVKKEKIGDRITALHKMVSPFGKTDTASVLLEVMGYIKFLQAQIRALSLPYLSIQSNVTHHDYDEEAIKDLWSRGLCLVPVSRTMQVGIDNGADYWAPANNFQL